jgi:hypothetical protein
MPYIKQEDRQKYLSVLKAIEYLPAIENKGDLEFLVFTLQAKFMKTREPRYGTLHEAVYAVTHSAHEFERRFLDKREDKARQENGDIEI